MSEEREPEGQIGSESELGDVSEQQIGSESEPDDQLSGSESEPSETAEQLSGMEMAADEQPPPAPAETEGESRAGRFFKRVLRWVVLLLVIFTLGVVAMQFVRVQPLREERNDLYQSLSEAQAIQQDLQAEVDRLEGVDEENQVLSESLRQAEARLALLNILVDITRAQLALAQGDTVRVAAALQGTGEKLNALRELLEPTELDALRERLVLVLSEVDGDPFAAERDLEILANTLLEIERELSAE